MEQEEEEEGMPFNSRQMKHMSLTAREEPRLEQEEEEEEEGMPFNSRGMKLTPLTARLHMEEA